MKQWTMYLFTIILIGISCKPKDTQPAYLAPVFEQTVISDIQTVAVTSKIVTIGTGTISDYGFCYGLNNDPRTTDTKISLGKSLSTPQVLNGTLTGLTTGTVYYVRAYAVDNKQTTYGDVTKFQKLSLTPPKITTGDATDISVNAFSMNGQLTDLGTSDVTEYGHCISIINKEPTLADNPTKMGISNSVPKNFKSVFTALTPNTTYYVRAYATNTSGTAYGDIKNVTTANLQVATLTTSDVIKVTTNTAIFSGSLNNIGTNPISNYGFCYSSTNSVPVESDTKVSLGSASNTLTFSGTANNLTPNTTYYVRAFATSVAGTGYGEVRSFKTDNYIEPTITTTIGSLYLKGSAVANNFYKNQYIDIVGTETISGTNLVVDRGFVIGSQSGATLTNNLNKYSNISFDNATGKTFKKSIEVLTLLSKTNFIRAYSTDSKGTTIYGQEAYLKLDFEPQLSISKIECDLIEFSIGLYALSTTPVRFRIEFISDKGSCVFTKKLTSLEMIGLGLNIPSNGMNNNLYTVKNLPLNTSWVLTDNPLESFSRTNPYKEVRIYADFDTNGKNWVGISTKSYTPCFVVK